MDSSRSDRWTDRLFTAHPRDLGIGWAEHGIGAAKIGAELIASGGACLIHALVPGFFTQTAGKTVSRLNSKMLHRKAGAANPNDWPDYEI